MKMIPYTVRFLPEVHRGLKRAKAQQPHLSMNAIINMLLGKALAEPSAAVPCSASMPESRRMLLGKRQA